MTVIPIVIDALGSIAKRRGKETGRLRNNRISREHSDYCIIKIELNTEKSSGNVRRLAVT